MTKNSLKIIAVISLSTAFFATIVFSFVYAVIDPWAQNATQTADSVWLHCLIVIAFAGATIVVLALCMGVYHHFMHWVYVPFYFGRYATEEEMDEWLSYSACSVFTFRINQRVWARKTSDAVTYRLYWL